MTKNYFHPFERGVIVTGNPPVESWQGFFRACKGNAKRMPFVIGDALAYGQLTYGQLTIDQEFDEDDFCDSPVLNKGTAYNWKSVSIAWWPPERKVYAKPWSWYQATASLPPDEQDEVMIEAITLKKNRDQLRALVADYHQKANRRVRPVAFPGDREFEQTQEIHKQQEIIDNLVNQIEQPSRMREPVQVSTIITRLDSILKLSPTEAAKNMFHIFAELKQIVEELRQL